MNFNIDVNKYVNAMLPTALRKPVFKAFLKVLLKPILAYYAITNAFFQIKLNEIQPNLLTDILQSYLRVLYPNTIITNYKCFIINQHELTPQIYLQFIGGHIAQQTSYNIGETFTQENTYYIDEQRPQYDYYVIIPTFYNFPTTYSKLKSFLDKYRPVGKSYLIKFQNIV
jgi:hypothetical protein